MKRTMFFKTKWFYKIAVWMVVFSHIVSVSAISAKADMFDIGSVTSMGSGSMNSVIEDVEKRYHLDQNSLQNFGESMNSSGNKSMAPQVSVFFNPTDPKPGKEVTAQAFPMYFSNKKEDMYFTWYLKRKDCEFKHLMTVEKWEEARKKRVEANMKDNRVTRAQAEMAERESDELNRRERECDVNADNEIEIDDWKMMAMRKIANGGFVGDKASYSVNSSDDDGYKARFGGDKNFSDGHCYVHDFESGNEYELRILDKLSSKQQKKQVWSNGCRHLFADPNTKEEKDKWKNDSDRNESAYRNSVGEDGSFGVAEELFWRTDPADPSTAQNGNKDEANVVGLNQDKFTWNYAADDKVGVVVEGLSMNPTKYKDSSMKVMWAFSKNKCVPQGVGVPPALTGASYNGGAASIPTAVMDLNDCLNEKSLVDPTEGDQAGRLDVQLTSSPENPIIDSFSDTEVDRRGNILTVQSSLSNSSVRDALVQYDWRVYANSDQSATAEDAWDDITEGLLSAKAVSGVKGSGLSSLKINLNINDKTKVVPTENSLYLDNLEFFKRYFKDNEGYFRIAVTATENFDKGKKRIGRSSVIVKIMRSPSQIKTHDVRVTTSGKLDFSAATSTDDGLLCESDVAERTLCPVVSGQIVGLTFDPSDLDETKSRADISWTLNNKPLVCSPGVSDIAACDSTKPEFGRKNFFPVTGEPGDIYTVTMTANNPLSGKSVTLSRIFRVVEPSLLIASADSAKVWPKYLGQYVDASGKTVDNYSQDVFEAFSGSPFALKGLFYPGSLRNNTNVTWLVNGVAAVPDSNGLVSVDGTQGVGSVYTVSIKGMYVPSPTIRKALSDIWGISISDTAEKVLSRDIQIEMGRSMDGLALGPLGTSKKFFASLISYVPASVVFFFRLAVTMGLILLVLGITFSYIPEKRRL